MTVEEIAAGAQAGIEAALAAARQAVDTAAERVKADLADGVFALQESLAPDPAETDLDSALAADQAVAVADAASFALVEEPATGATESTASYEMPVGNGYAGSAALGDLDEPPAFDVELDEDGIPKWE